MAKARKFDLPEAPAAVSCRACGLSRPLDAFRYFTTSPVLLMDFCSDCELREGTITLYRRYNAYGTPAIIDAVFAANRVPVARRTPDQVRLLLEGKGERPAASNEELIHREIARREMCRRRLLYFTTTMMPEYKPGWVHQDICRRLERFVRMIEEGKSPRLVIAMPPRHGKQLAHETPMFTPDGWKTHGELAVGDSVFHPSGAPTAVVAVARELPQDCAVEFMDGEVIKCHQNHEWEVYDRARAEWRVVDTAYLETQALVSGPKLRARFQVRAREALQMPAKELPIDPYFLGAWLGDGKSSSPVICGAQSDLDQVTALIPYPRGARYVHAGTGVHYQTFVAGIRGLLRKNGLLGNKHIPATYFTASVEQRLRLLSGLVDTDGCLEPETQRIRFRSGDEKLARQVVDLVQGLGYRASIDYTPADTRERHISGGESWCVQWTPHDGRGGGLLPRKTVSRMRKRRRIGLKRVWRTTPTSGRCIEVAAEDGLYLAGKNLIPTHNSQLASDMLPSWILGLHPEWGIIGSSHSQTLPLEFSRNMRDRLRDPEFQAIFPDTRLRADTQGIEAWKTTKGGGYIAAGVGTGINGKGMHVGILDDALKDAEAAASETIRTNTFAWYQSVFRTRLAPGGGILIIATRWHFDDPTGRVLSIDEQLKKAGVPEEERENWDVISYPAIAEADEYMTTDGEILQGTYEGDSANIARLLRSKGDALHPERYPLGELKKLKNGYSGEDGMASSIWNALYQQNPTPDDGDFFRKENFRYRWLDPVYRPMCRIFMTVDYAIGKKERNDFTVMGVFALDSNDDLYVLEIRRGRWGTMEIVKNAKELVVAHKVETYAGEQGQIHHAVWPMIKSALDKDRLYVSVDETLVPIQDKETRARPLQGRLQRNKLFFSFDSATRPDIYDITEREMLQFPNGANDDIVDMLAWGGRLAMNTSLPNSQPVPVRQKSWTDKLRAATTSSNFMAS